MDKDLDKFGRPYPPKAGKYYLPSITTDAVVIKPFSSQDAKDRVILMITRKHNPFKNCLALPGGFVDYNEDPKEGVIRELKEETCLDGTVHSLVGAYGNPQRDPRGHNITLAYRIQVSDDAVPRASDDAADARFFSLSEIHMLGQEGKIAFDHYEIIKDALAAESNF